MNCECARKQFSLYLYGELSVEEEQALEDHMEACPECRKKFQSEKGMHRLLDGRERLASPALLAQCRRDLATQIKETAPRRGLLRWVRGIFSGGPRWLPALTRPAAAIVLASFGFLVARVTMPAPAGSPLVAIPEGSVISRVRNVQPDASGQVRIVLDETRQRIVTGHPDDEQIHRLLLAVARESGDPGLRGESMDILKSRPDTADVRAALLQTVEHDPNPGVRLKALEGLKRFAATPEVRTALSRVLLNDDNPGLRTQAIDLLMQNRGGGMVGMLQEVVEKENNGYVRLRCQKALQEMNASVGTF
jgi:anti-sigma factor RsiW